MMEKIRTLIVDDEVLAREGLRLLMKDDPQIEIIGECVNGYETIRALQLEMPDLLFLDVQMPGMNGFETLAQSQVGRLPTVIFVTAYDDYALQAFEAQALDYLLKPFSDERFYMALKRAKEQVEQKQVKEQNQKLQTLLQKYEDDEQARALTKGQRQTSGFIERLMLKAGARIFFIQTAEIDWIEAADYYALLHVGDKSHLLRETLTELEAKLDPQKFVRIHRSTVVNIERVKELYAQGSGDYAVVLHDGTTLRLSRRRREKLQFLLQKLS
jgi:two-component system, LytTR family, response regulator